MAHKEDYKRLPSEYLDAHSLMYKKIRAVDSYIGSGDMLLDIGMGTGETGKNYADRV